MKFKEYMQKIDEHRIPGFDGYAKNKRRASGMARKITIKSTLGNPRLSLPIIGDEETSPITKKRNDRMRYVLRSGKFTRLKRPKNKQK